MTNVVVPPINKTKALQISLYVLIVFYILYPIYQDCMNYDWNRGKRLWYTATTADVVNFEAISGKRSYPKDTIPETTLSHICDLDIFGPYIGIPLRYTFILFLILALNKIYHNRLLDPYCNTLFRFDNHPLKASMTKLLWECMCLYGHQFAMFCVVMGFLRFWRFKIPSHFFMETLGLFWFMFYMAIFFYDNTKCPMTPFIRFRPLAKFLLVVMLAELYNRGCMYNMLWTFPIWYVGWFVQYGRKYPRFNCMFYEMPPIEEGDPLYKMQQKYYGIRKARRQRLLNAYLKPFLNKNNAGKEKL